MIKAIPTAFLALALLSTSFLPTADGATAHIVAVTMQDASVDPSISGMVMKADTARVKAGRVTLEAVNQSKNLVHEVLIVPALPEGKELPYDTKKEMVVEKQAHSLGEIAELQPGVRGKLTLDLKPGTYILLCNQPGHYKSGMWTKLIVEK